MNVALGPSIKLVVVVEELPPRGLPVIRTWLD